MAFDRRLRLDNMHDSTVIEVADATRRSRGLGLGSSHPYAHTAFY
jgi:hypothetical protein